MKLGMFMHPIQDFRRGYHTLLKEDFEIIKCADAVGFDEVWLGEHFALPSEPIQSPLMLFAALVPQTERIKFGSGVLCLPYQHPAIVAGQAAQFDHISEGRFLMGIGPGATPPDFEMFKITDLDRMEMLVESIDMIHGIWASDPPYEFHGKYWDFEIKDNVLADIGVGAMGKPYQQPHPPVMIPAMSRGSGSIRLAAQRDWLFISANFVPDDVLKGHWRDYLDERKKLGLAPNPSKWKAGRTLLITETDEEARQYLRREDNAFRWYFEVHHRRHQPRRLRPHAQVGPRHAGRGGDARVLHRHHRHRRQPQDGGQEDRGVPRRDRPVRDPDRLAPRLGP